METETRLDPIEARNALRSEAEMIETGARA